MKKWLILVSLLALFSGCNSNVSNSLNGTNSVNRGVLSEGSSMEYKIIKQADVPFDENEYMNGKEESLVFYSDKSEDVKKFNLEYKKLTGKEAPEFDGTMIVEKMGTKRSGGYAMEFAGLKDSGRYIDLTIKYIYPQKGSLVTEAFTNPYMIIYLPNNHKEVRVFH